MTKVPFLALILGPDMNTDMGVVMCTESILHNIWIPVYVSSWFNSFGSSVFSDIPFLAFLALHRKRKRCGQVEPSPCYFQSEVVYAY